MAGLTAAAALAEAGAEVAIFDKGRRPGGRIATRETPQGDFDHGPGGLAARDPAFAALLSRLGAVRGADGDWRARPRMAGLLAPWGERLGTSSGREVVRLARDGGDWRLGFDDGAAAGGFARVLLALPAPQAARLAGGRLAEMLADVTMAPCWTGMFAFAEPPDALPPVGDGIAVLRRGADPRCVVMQMTAAWSRDRLETERPAMAALLRETLAARAGRLPETRHVAAHRWRHARTERPLGQDHAAAGGLLAGGDWALGPDAEDAWRSGLALARAAGA